jgi:thioredoxin-like negative regulator of GroEL
MPCHQLAPVLAEVADRLGSRLRGAKVNIDEQNVVWERSRPEASRTWCCT